MPSPWSRRLCPTVFGDPDLREYVDNIILPNDVRRTTGPCRRGGPVSPSPQKEPDDLELNLRLLNPTVPQNPKQQ